MAVVQGVDHGHGAGQGPFDRLAGLLAQKTCILNKHGFGAADRAHHRRHAGIVAVTDSDRLALLKINAVQVLDKGGNKVLTSLLTVTDDIDAGVQLLLQRYAQRVLFAVSQFLARELPGRPQLFRLGQPGGFWQAACGRGG